MTTNAASTIAWGVLGYARIAKMSAIPAILRTPNARFHGIASRNEQKLTECKAHFSDIASDFKTYPNYEDLIADPDIQAIYIPLPNTMHKAWTLAALRAGKHVLCEKPLAMTADDAREMAIAARESGCLLMEAFMYRYTDRVKRVREVLDSGALGTIRNISASFRFFLDRANTIKVQPELGGGSLYDVGCYPVNFLRVVTGKQPVSCRALAELENGVDVNLSAILQYDDGLIANIHCGFNAYFKMDAEIVGTEGVLEVPDTFMGEGGHLRLQTKSGSRDIAVAESDRYGEEFRDFSAAILENRQPLLSLEESILNLEVLEMIQAQIASQGRTD